ncbi:MAG: hypothetical protein NTZ74_15830 [Chloroflexi bacterium]|nr:hypothetical protein [Chloroflexota bacterium]
MEIPQEVKSIKNNPFHFEWILPVFIKPCQAVKKIVTAVKMVWLTPLVVISILILISTLFAAPIRKNAIQMGLATPIDFQYYTADQQTQFLNAQASQTSPLFLYLFPVLTGLASILFSWFILSSLLHLSLTLSGSRANSIRSYNLAAWSFLPIAVRYLVQIGAMIVARSLVTSPGLSGFIPSDAGGVLAYRRGP